MHRTIDPELNYCPQCGDEYRADIRICADCSVDLLSGEQLLAQREIRPQDMASGSLEIDDHEPLRAVRKGPLFQMKELQAMLQDRMLPARVAKEEGGACGCRGPEVLLEVRERDLAEVMRVLEAEYRQSTCLADHDNPYIDAIYNTEVAEAVCPACGCRFPTSSTACPDCGLCFA